MHKAAVSPIGAPSTVDRDQGLCITCVHRETCGLRSRNATPVIFCEEFTPVAAGAVSSSAGLGHRLRTVAPPQPTREPEWIGLCKSCANRHHCTLRKPLGGVWHCEEFA